MLLMLTRKTWCWTTSSSLDLSLSRVAKSKEEKSDLERVQKVASKIVLNSRYTNYIEALENLSIVTLSERRDILSLKFAPKNPEK